MSECVIPVAFFALMRIIYGTQHYLQRLLVENHCRMRLSVGLHNISNLKGQEDSIPTNWLCQTVMWCSWKLSDRVCELIIKIPCHSLIFARFQFCEKSLKRLEQKKWAISKGDSPQTGTTPQTAGQNGGSYSTVIKHWVALTLVVDYKVWPCLVQRYSGSSWYRFLMWGSVIRPCLCVS